MKRPLVWPVVNSLIFLGLAFFAGYHGQRWTAWGLFYAAGAMLTALLIGRVSGPVSKSEEGVALGCCCALWPLTWGFALLASAFDAGQKAREEGK